MKSLHRRWKLMLAVMLIATLFSEVCLWASSLEIYHMSGEVMIDGQPFNRFDENNSLEMEVPLRTTYYVKIMDNNPFLFTYDSKVVAKDSQNYIIFKQFVEAIDSTNLFYNVPEEEENTLKGYIATIKTITLSIEELLDERKGIIDATITSKASLDETRENVDQWNLFKLKEDLNDAYAALTLAITVKSTVPENNKKMLKLLEDLESTKNSLANLDKKGLSAEKEKEGRIFMEYMIQELKNEINDLNKKIYKAQLYNKHQSVYQDELQNAISLLAREDVVKKTLADLIEFEEILGQVNRGKIFKGGVDGKDTRKQKTDTINIVANPQFSDLLSEKAKKVQSTHVGVRTIIFNPISFVEFRKAAGAVYSFVENSEFEVVEDDQGNKIISQSSDDYRAFGGALMLNIIPSSMYGSTFEPFMQLGASVDGEDIGGLLGGGFSFFPFPDDSGNLVSSFTLSGGVICQQVNELSNGLHVGDSLTTEVVTNDSTTKTVTSYDLETDKKWDAGLYLMMGVNF